VTAITDTPIAGASMQHDNDNVRVDIPADAYVVKAIFDDIPGDDIASEILEHVERTGEPHTWRGRTHKGGRMMDSAAGNDNRPSYLKNPRIASRGEWIGNEFYPDTRFHKKPQAAIDAAKAEDRILERRERVRLGKRAAIGKDWDGRADNDNINWPLATALLREGNTELLKAAVAYRRIHAQAHCGAVLGGSSAPLGKGMALDQRTHITASGNVVYKGARSVETAEPESQPTMKVLPYVAEDDGVERNTTRVPKPWNGDQPVNDMIDAQTKLVALRERLGALVEPLELSVVDGKTYQEVGNSVGVANRAGALGAGRATVHLALLTLRDSLGNIKRSDLAA